MEKRNSQLERLVLQVQLGCGSLSITTPASLLANEFVVRSVLHRQVSWSAINQICVVPEAMKGCTNLKIFEMP